MSMVLTRSPLEPIGMNGGGAQKRRSARLSKDGADENEPPAKKAKGNTTTVGTKEQDGGSTTAPKKKRQVYDQKDDDFTFTKSSKSKRGKQAKEPAVRNSDSAQPAAPEPTQTPAPPTTGKKTRRRFPTTPEREEADRPRANKQLPKENIPVAPQPSPHRAAHARSHANTERSPSPGKAAPLTVEKKRKHGPNGMEEEQKIMRIQLPFQDTPVIRRNRDMRKSSGEGMRRTSSGMRGRRASSLIEEGRGNAMPHTEVHATEFFKHISAELTEPRRMRCLLGWCGTRNLPPKPEAPKDNTPASNLEFQALQAARVIQEELSIDLIAKGVLSDWFSRDESAPDQIPLRRKANPRNVTNTAKAEELEKELERLKQEREEWDKLIDSAVPAPNPPTEQEGAEETSALSPFEPDILDESQRQILEQLQAPTTSSATDPAAIQQRLAALSQDLEFSIDQFAHGIHALSTTKSTADRLADRALADSATILDEREKKREGPVDGMDALRTLGKVMNPRR